MDTDKRGSGLGTTASVTLGFRARTKSSPNSVRPSVRHLPQILDPRPTHFALQLGAAEAQPLEVGGVRRIRREVSLFVRVRAQVKDFLHPTDDPADVFPVPAADAFRRRDDLAAPFELVKKVMTPGRGRLSAQEWLEVAALHRGRSRDARQT